MKIKLVSLTEEGHLIVDNEELRKVVITKYDMDKLKYKPIVYNKNQSFFKYNNLYTVYRRNYEYAVGIIKEAFIENNEVFLEVDFFNSLCNNSDLDYSKITKCDNFCVNINDCDGEYKIEEFMSAELFEIPKIDKSETDKILIVDGEGNIVQELVGLKDGIGTLSDLD